MTKWPANVPQEKKKDSKIYDKNKVGQSKDGMEGVSPQKAVVT